MSQTSPLFSQGTVTYRDFSISMKSNPMTGDIVTVTNILAIKQALNNLILTNAGERPFRQMGGDLLRLLKEPLDIITELELKQALSNIIIMYEPRVTLISINLTENINFDAINVTMIVSINNSLEPQTISIVLDRIR